MPDIIIQTYNDVDITYREATNDFAFELRGRERVAPSLKLAKEAIDKPPPKEKDDSFKRVKCWLKEFSGWSEVEVTSICDGPVHAYRGQEAWVVDAKGKRSKEPLKALYPITPGSTTAVNEWLNCDTAARTAQARQLHIVEKMTPLTV